MKEELIQLKQSELAEYRKRKHQEQNGVCPVLGVEVLLENCCVDHCHRTKTEEIGGEEAKGLVRGVLSSIANSWEGKVVNSFRRMGLHKYNVPIWTALRNLADYLEFSRTNLIHPSEKIKPPKITKLCYNLLVKRIKAINKKEKIPPYPRSGKLTVKLEKLFAKYEIEVKYYSSK